MAQTIRDLLKTLKNADFAVLAGGGKGSHRQCVDPNCAGAVTVSGQTGDDAKRYQGRDVVQVIEIKRN